MSGLVGARKGEAVERCEPGVQNDCERRSPTKEGRSRARIVKGIERGAIISHVSSHAMQHLI